MQRDAELNHILSLAQDTPDAEFLHSSYALQEKALLSPNATGTLICTVEVLEWVAVNAVSVYTYIDARVCICMRVSSSWYGRHRFANGSELVQWDYWLGRCGDKIHVSHT